MTTKTLIDIAQNAMHNEILRTFAQRHGLKIRQKDCGELFIPGKVGEIFMYSQSLLAMLLQDPNGTKQFDRLLSMRVRRAVRAGFGIQQRGDFEGICLFDPTDEKKSKLAIRLAGVRRRRIPSLNQLANLRRGSARWPSHVIEATNTDVGIPKHKEKGKGS